MTSEPESEDLSSGSGSEKDLEEGVPKQQPRLFEHHFIPSFGDLDREEALGAVIEHQWLADYCDGPNEPAMELEEVLALRALRCKKSVAVLEFWQAPTCPLIAGFIRAISSNPAYNIERIRENLFDHHEDVSKALTQGRSYDVIAFTLQKKEVYFWILDYPLPIKDNVKFSRLLCNMHDLYGENRLPAFRQQLLDVSDQIKDFFAPLSGLSEQTATEKLLLMVNFPQYAAYIYEHTFAEALKFIFGANLTAWRAKMANNMNWEGKSVIEHLRFMRLEHKKNYYDGYVINCKFDDLIFCLERNELLALFNGGDREVFAESIRKYRRMVVMEERLGTVYSILQEKHGLAGQIDPLSEEVDNNFEKQIIMTLSGGNDTGKFWVGQKYLQSVNVLASRLVFHSGYDVDSYCRNSFQDDKSNFINNIQDIHSSIAKICSLPENSTLSGQIKRQRPSHYYELFSMVFYNLIEHCVPEVCIPNILNYLDDSGEEEFVTSKLLLTLLREVARRHFPEAKRICFDCFSEELKNGLLSLLKK